MMKIKMRGAGGTWGFVEGYWWSNSGESRTVRFIAGFSVDTGMLVAPSTFFGKRFKNLEADDVEKYCRSKKAFLSKFQQGVVPVSVRVVLKGGKVSIKARPILGRFNRLEGDVVLGKGSMSIERALVGRLGGFINGGDISREKFYKERIKWAEAKESQKRQA